MAINLHPHARERMEERGATENEVIVTVKEGEKFLVKFGRIGFRHNFSFESRMANKYYHTKQVEVYATQEKNKDWLVLTVITRYF